MQREKEREKTKRVRNVCSGAEMVKTPVSICFYRKKITARKERSGLQGHRCMSLRERIVRKKSEPFVAQGQIVVKPVYVCV